MNSVQEQQGCALHRTHQGCVGSRFVAQNSQCCLLKHYKAVLSLASPPFSLSFVLLEFTLRVKGEIDIPKLTDQDLKDV